MEHWSARSEVAESIPGAQTNTQSLKKLSGKKANSQTLGDVKTMSSIGILTIKYNEVIKF